ncbi:CC-NBS-LRR resistance protein [Trifolium pratense]|uniref:CC-NBS-LRR resistance protein n=1 Tax=Trifolium pratense TaxID=57577 RepID=A0A2K3NQ68_TRIPR|nr:CC-NBS-LRR resistance protein [Trifolium pratense]
MDATTSVASAFLSATVESLLQKLASSELIDYVKYSHLNILKLTVLETKLLTLHSVLHDAEHKQFFNPEVKNWLDELYDVISTAEDLFDEIGYSYLQCKVENTQSQHDFEYNSDIAMICQKLQGFAEQIEILGLQSVTVSVRVSVKMCSNLVGNETVVVGRKNDKELLMNMLMSESGNNNSNNNLGVVAVFGVGGVGKSTLARIVYDDEKVNEHFDLKAWVRMSEDFDVVRVTKTITESVTSGSYGINDPDYMRAELKKEVRGRRFLIVLDGLWNYSYNDWHGIVAPLIKGKYGSRVVITTRYEEVAKVAHTFPIHKLEPLSEEDCWPLLSKYVFGSVGNKFPNLEAIGRNIARKCGGLPLAAKIVGRLLSSKIDEKEWIEIMNNDIWNLSKDNILPSLLMSYQYLPSYLKRCFAYCSIFPKGYPIDRKQMVLLWMAQGFLEHSMVEKTEEEVGNEYFTELLSRSLIEQLNDDTDREKFVMHCLVHDLATIVSGKSGRGRIHHFLYHQEEYDLYKKFEIVDDFECLRSFLSIDFSWRMNYISSKVLHVLLPSHGRLRALSISHYSNITTLPDSLGSLVQLRYLNLSCTGIKYLPDTICDLYYLQTLKLSGCRKLIELPAHVGNLINLRHLDISHTNIEEMPMQLVELENLQTLTVFVVGQQEVGLSVRELSKFPNLRGKLHIQNLHKVIDVSEVCDTKLKSKEHIEELSLYWGKQTEDSPSQEVILDELQPSTNLKKLSISFYGGTSFPSWLGDCSFSNMVYLCIKSCEYCTTLPPLGQLPSLKDLEIDGMSKVETIGPEFYGMIGGSTNTPFQPFPSLEKLHFERMSNWKEWLSFGGSKFPFPRLKTLYLDNCSKLRGHLPSHLPSIEKITILWCSHLLATLSTLQWLSSVKYINLITRGSSELPLLENDSPCLLQLVTIFGFNKLLSLPRMFLNSTSLQHLHLCYISSLTAFPSNGLPTSLKSLDIDECKNLAFLPPETWSNYTSLVTLNLKNCCDGLTSFQLNGFPMLHSLSVDGCSNLESIFISENGSLGSSTLQSLQVSNCDALRSLPQHMETLTALESLTLDSLSSCWKGVRLPLKFRLTPSHSMTSTTTVTERGLQNLTALSDMEIGGNNVVNTLLKEQLLPIFLVSLTITNLSEMKCLEGNVLQHISSMKKLAFKFCSGLESFQATLPSSLKSLVFENCPKLMSLPDKLPSSLETLEFDDCARLGLLPRHGFPSSLKVLSISQCPFLEARYATPRRGQVSKIAHIPVIKINYQAII